MSWLTLKFSVSDDLDKRSKINFPKLPSDPLCLPFSLIAFTFRNLKWDQGHKGHICDFA